MRNEPGPLPKTWKLPESIVIRLGREAGPQRAIAEEGHLLLILHEVPDADAPERRPSLFWREPAGEWHSSGGGKPLTSLQELLRNYSDRLQKIEVTEDKASTASEYHRVLEEAAPVLRASRGLHRALQQAREQVKADRDLISFRDEAAGIERTAELLLQDAQFGLSFTAARQAEAQAASAQRSARFAHKLNILAALFLPLTAIASLFGMEIQSGIGNVPGNFWMIAVTGIVLGVLLSLMLVRGD